MNIHQQIPIILCEYAVLNRKINYLKLFFYLKQISSGHLAFDYCNYCAWSIDLGVSKKTVEKCFKWLIKKKWITVNNNRKSYRLISKRQLVKKFKNTNSFSIVIFEEDDFSNFSNFCNAAVFTYQLKIKHIRDRRKRSVSKMARTSKNRSTKSFGLTMPVSYFAKVLQISESSANNIKNRALESGYLERKRSVTTFRDDSGAKIGKENLRIFQKSIPEDVGRLRVGRKFIKIVDPDIFVYSLVTKKRSINWGKK